MFKCLECWMVFDEWIEAEVHSNTMHHKVEEIKNEKT